MKRVRWDFVVSTASWIIVAILFYGVWFILTTDLNPASMWVQLFGDPGVRYVFAFYYSAQAGLLAYAKLKKKNTLRKNVLLVIYLNGFFFGISGMLLNGFSQRTISNVIMSACAALCWLYWKFRTDYMTQQEAADFIGTSEQDS